MAVQFGVVTGAATYGVAQNVEVTDEEQTETYTDATGSVAGVQSYEAQKKVSCEYIHDGTAMPTVGGTMTIGAFLYVVTSVKVIEEAKGFMKCQIEGIRWVTGTLPV